MSMQLNEKFFSFPPHISVSWENVSAIRIDNSGNMVFLLNTGDSIPLPPLAQEEIEQIFKAHAQFLEKRVLKEAPIKHERIIPGMRQGSESAVRFVFGSLDGMNSTMQHNSAESHAPNLPEEMLFKIAELTKIFAPDPEALPKAEPHCNCPHCQLARAIQGTLPERNVIQGTFIEAVEVKAEEEEVKITDLQFQDWIITQTGDKLYTVTNKIDKLESYSVYLGHPVGCTCGKQNCDHILAVLKS